MIGNQTSLDLNGPILSFIQQPQSVTISCEDVLLGSVATFIGIATATFPEQTPPNPATNTGTISYRWYDDNGPLFDDPPPSGGDGVTIVGSATTTLRLYNSTRSRKIFLRAEYIPSAYSQPSGSSVEVGTARSTGNAINEPIDSNIVDLDLNPTIILTSQPIDQTAAETRNAVFSTSAFASDGSNLSYQWQFNGTNLNDATEQTTSITPVRTTLTVTDNFGQSTTVDFSSLSSYSNFVTGRTYTLVSNANLETRLTAFGAGGGTSINRSVAGGLGGSAVGTFTFLAGETYRLIVGGAGGNGGGAGFGGGGSGGGGTGQGGGGGGYTGLFLNSVSQANAIIIAGGGGGGNDDPASGSAGGGTSGGGGGGRNGGGGTQSSGGSGGSGDGSSGSPGSALQGGSGGAGGGGGYFGGGGGQSYNGCCAGGSGGGGSAYLHPTLLTNATTTLGGGSTAGTDGTFKIDLVSSSRTVNVTATGTKTPNLTIRTDAVGLNQVNCVISHPVACNSPIITRIANFNVVSAREILNFESVNDDGNFLGSGSVNLFNNPTTFTADPNNAGRSLVLYAPEKDVRVRITLAGGAGLSRGSRGGEGGLSVFEYILKQNTEYTFKLGAATPPTGGSNGGGGAAFLYEKARLIAVCGGGGGSGTSSRGGDGGGIGVGGEPGQGRNGGAGGRRVGNGELPTGSGFFPSGTSGGQVSGCTIGEYYRQVGFSPCQDVGQQQWRGLNGNITTQTAVIQRGYKAGLGYRNNGGNGSGNEGGGAGGTFGGNAGTGDGSGGGGGSGYTDGSITLVDTRLGGNNSTNAFARIESLS